MVSKIDDLFQRDSLPRKAKELWNAAVPGDDRAVFENPGIVKSEVPFAQSRGEGMLTGTAD
jgi:hypothetical protein